VGTTIFTVSVDMTVKMVVPTWGKRLCRVGVWAGAFMK
jgi:hypothetical protein